MAEDGDYPAEDYSAGFEPPVLGVGPREEAAGPGGFVVAGCVRRGARGCVAADTEASGAEGRREDEPRVQVVEIARVR